VTIFFFLSGYLITTLLRREHQQTGRISLRDFYLRRVIRILPPMYVFLTVAVTLTAVGLVAGQLTGLGIAAAVLNFTNYVILFGDPSNLVPGAGLLWSLAVEEHFYLLFPLLYLALLPRMSRRRQTGVLIGLCLATLAWRCVLVFGFGAGYDRTYFGTDTRADALLAGCLLAVAANPVLDRISLRPARSLAVILVGGSLLVLGEQLPDALAATVGQTLEEIGLFLIFGAILAAPRSIVGRLLDWRPLAHLGVLSYSFYLFHGLVLTVIEGITGHGPRLAAAFGFPLTVAISEAVYRLIEGPLARLRRRLAHQQATSVPAMAEATATG
jgi:peptidoglycan/LPS O-acetylase OafA/YrhL